MPTITPNVSASPDGVSYEKTGYSFTSQSIPNEVGQSPSVGELNLVATTGINGFALQDGTPTILSWTAPDDGNMHRAIFYLNLHVTSALTGGIINANWNGPDDAGYQVQIANGGYGQGTDVGSPIVAIVGSGKTVTISQATAITQGDAIVWAEIWAS